jgi:hypothetical protein
MGYFSNGSEYECWRVSNCDRCANDGDERYDIGCAIQDAHTALCYGASEDTRTVLDMLIPRSKDGLGNGRCRMFRPKAGA